MNKQNTLDDVAAMLEATGRYRCLRCIPRLDPDTFMPAPEDAFVGIIVDCEATGLDPERATPIEIGMVKFAYDQDGTILNVVDTFEGRQQPDEPLDPHVEAITGISMADLEGRRIDVAALKTFVSDANLMVAQHARYDRPLLERFIDLPLRPWACSLLNIDWTSEGIFDRRLKDLLAMHGLLNSGAHRAVADCEALLEVLRRPLPHSGRTGLAALLASARRVSTVIFAEATPIATRVVLKARGYRWLAGEDGCPRCWWTEIDAAAAKAELKFLKEDIYLGTRWGATMTIVSALHRYRSMPAIARVRTPAPEPE